MRILTLAEPNCRKFQFCLIFNFWSEAAVLTFCHSIDGVQRQFLLFYRSYRYPFSFCAERSIYDTQDGFFCVVSRLLYLAHYFIELLWSSSDKCVVFWWNKFKH
jgi:hypothetical protein